MYALSCRIEIENNTQCYRPGEIIKGLVVVDNSGSTALLLKALSLQFTGFACTKWKKSERINKSDKTKPEVFIEYREDYVSTNYYLIGSEMANLRPIVPGKYHYNFMINIPQNVPSTFDGDLGFIRYEITAYADYGDQINSLCNSPIIIEQLKDLRLLNSTVQLPAAAQHHEQKSLIKFWQQPLQLYVSVPQKAYTAGECISVNIKLTNAKKLKLKTITTKLNRIVTYKGLLREKLAQTRTEVTTIALNNHNLHEQNLNLIQLSQQIFIPQTPATFTFEECKCIALSYELEVLAICKKRGLSARIPILIGSVSLSSDIKILPVNVNNNNVASITVARSMEELTIPSASDLEDNINPIMDTRNRRASSFQEADFMTPVHLNKKCRHKIAGDLNDFKPKYLYYAFAEQVTPNVPKESTTINDHTSL